MTKKLRTNVKSYGITDLFGMAPIYHQRFCPFGNLFSLTTPAIVRLSKFKIMEAKKIARCAKRSSI